MTTTDSLIRIYCETIMCQDFKETERAKSTGLHPSCGLEDCQSSQAVFGLDCRRISGRVRRKHKMEDLWEVQTRILHFPKRCPNQFHLKDNPVKVNSV